MLFGRVADMRLYVMSLSIKEVHVDNERMKKALRPSKLKDKMPETRNFNFEFLTASQSCHHRD